VHINSLTKFSELDVDFGIQLFVMRLKFKSQAHSDPEFFVVGALKLELLPSVALIERVSAASRI
jgi:hypothetical protein